VSGFVSALSVNFVGLVFKIVEIGCELQYPDSIVFDDSTSLMGSLVIYYSGPASAIFSLISSIYS
jgi:hypothetical protein